MPSVRTDARAGLRRTKAAQASLGLTSWVTSLGDPVVGNYFQVILMRNGAQLGHPLQGLRAGRLVEDKNIVLVVSEHGPC